VKATVLYTVDDTTHSMEITGDQITNQFWGDDRGRIVVRNDEGTLRRVVHFTQAWLIDVEYE
jgi:hypothetical protein